MFYQQDILYPKFLPCFVVGSGGISLFPLSFINEASYSIGEDLVDDKCLQAKKHPFPTVIVTDKEGREIKSGKDSLYEIILDSLLK